MKSRNIGETTFACIAMMGLPVAMFGVFWWHGWLLAAAAVAGEPECDKPEPEAKRGRLRAVK